MPLLRKGVLIPVKGIDFSQPSTFIDDRAGFPQNMRYYKSELRKRPGKTTMGAASADGSQIMGLGRLELSGGVKYTIRASKKKLEKYNTTTELWDSIAAVDFTGGDDNFFSFAEVTESQFVVVTNGYDRIRKWTGSGNNSLLGGNPPFAKYCCYISPYLLIAHLDDGSTIRPWKVQWPDTDNPEIWTGGNSGSRLLSDDSSPIQNIAKLDKYAAVYKQESLWIGYKVDPPDIFRFECIKTGLGLSASRAFADVEGVHFFMGENDFYLWRGLSDPEPIGGPVRDHVFERIDRNKMARNFAVPVKELNEVWFFVTITGNNWPTEVWKYNYRTGFWYFDTCSEMSAAFTWRRTTGLSWNDDSGAWDDTLGIWDSGVTSENREEALFGDVNGLVLKLDHDTVDDAGVAVDAQFVSKDYTGDTLEFMKRWLQLDVWARGPGKLYIDYSVDFGENWVNVPYTSSQAYIDLDDLHRKYEMYFDVFGEQIRFRFRNNVSGETFYLRNFYPYYRAAEQTRTHR